MKKQQKKTKEITVPVYMMNRELSWLKFNERVLNEAGNPRVPLAERLTFAAIYQSNLDEFYRVRVGTLMDQMEASEVIRENKTNMTSEEQVTAIIQATRNLDQKKAAIYEQLMGELEPYGVRLINFNRLSAEEGKLLETYFDQEIAPYLSANIVSKQQPFPFLKNKNIYAVASLMSKGGKTKTAIIPCSNTVFRRLIDIPTRKGTFMLSEELILHFLPKMFKSYEIREKALLRITRNADIDTETIYDEDLDYRDAMENLIKQRRRMNPVRMELSRELNKKMISSLCKELHVDKEHVFLTRVPLDMSFVFGLQGYLRNTAQDKLFYQRRTPRMTPELDDKSALIPQIMKKDVLLSYPFENIRSFINLLNEAAKDDSVVSIKMTLYRLADKSQIVDALVEAAENGKEVTVLIELRARFDEQNNIDWSERLEEAGCRVLYGFDGYKVHSKLCLITYRNRNEIRYITQVGTGNYNEKTAKMYTDYSLMTSHQGIGEDAAVFFKNMSIGNLDGEYHHLIVSPFSLKRKVLRHMDEEIQKGADGRIIMKMNSVTDMDFIRKVQEASAAGVKVDLIVRGICCILPGVKENTENLRVTSIVGRYLEHPRVFVFGTGETAKVYIGSADMMTRNTEKRVEVACPIYDDAIKRRLIHDLKVMLADNVKARIMTSDGTYKKKERKGEAVNAQAAFMKAALNARPPKTLPKAKKEKKSIFQKVFSAFGKRNRSC